MSPPGRPRGELLRPGGAARGGAVTAHGHGSRGRLLLPTRRSGTRLSHDRSRNPAPVDALSGDPALRPTQPVQLLTGGIWEERHFSTNSVYTCRQTPLVRSRHGPTVAFSLSILAISGGSFCHSIRVICYFCSRSPNSKASCECPQIGASYREQELRDKSVETTELGSGGWGGTGYTRCPDKCVNHIHMRANYSAAADSFRNDSSD